MAYAMLAIGWDGRVLAPYGFAWLASPRDLLR